MDLVGGGCIWTWSAVAVYGPGRRWLCMDLVGGGCGFTWSAVAAASPVHVSRTWLYMYVVHLVGGGEHLAVLESVKRWLYMAVAVQAISVVHLVGGGEHLAVLAPRQRQHRVLMHHQLVLALRVMKGTLTIAAGPCPAPPHTVLSHPARPAIRSLVRVSRRDTSLAHHVPGSSRPCLISSASPPPRRLGPRPVDAPPPRPCRHGEHALTRPVDGDGTLRRIDAACAPDRVAGLPPRAGPIARARPGPQGPVRVSRRCRAGGLRRMPRR